MHGTTIHFDIAVDQVSCDFVLLVEYDSINIFQRQLCNDSRSDNYCGMLPLGKSVRNQ